MKDYIIFLGLENELTLFSNELNLFSILLGKASLAQTCPELGTAQPQLVLLYNIIAV
jgi:hypothetical protein